MIAIVCAASAVEPKNEMISAAPLNILSSTKTPKLIGPPILKSSKVLKKSGINLEWEIIRIGNEIENELGHE